MHTNYRANSTTSMVLKINQKPYNGTCVVDKTSGKALDTFFNILCTNWADFDGIVTKYEYFATFANNTNAYGLAFDNEGSNEISNIEFRKKKF